MQTDYLIVGQGLSGTWLSYWLMQLGAKVLVIDDGAPQTASKASSGIINPVTGRRMVQTWLAETLMPFCHTAYEDIAQLLSAHHVPTQSLITTTSIVDFFAAPDKRLEFEKRSAESHPYLQWPSEPNDWVPHFNYGMGYGIIAPVYMVAVQRLLAQWRQHLQTHQSLLSQTFQQEALVLNADGVSYNEITAKAIIFADGSPAMQSPYFGRLPFALNKGEALVVHLPHLPQHHIYKMGLTLMPLSEQLFWVGSTYHWQYEHAQATPAFRAQATQWLRQVVKHEFAIVDHWAALRPANVERRPFVGMHPLYQQVGILNGMGTKGVSLAPYFAQQLASHLTQGTAIMLEASVQRFQRLLSA